MKKTFVFVGSGPAHMMGVVSFVALGQAAALTEEQAKDLSRKSAIVRAEEFASIGFTPAELAKFGPFGAHSNATPEFTAKRLLALAAAEKLRAEFEAPAPSEEEAA